MNRQYIGARYVPKFFDNNGSNNWVSGIPYESLTIVTYLNNSYTSKKDVPNNVGNPSDNSEYWVLTGAYNEQIQEIANEVNELQATKYVVANSIFVEGLILDGITDNTEAIISGLDNKNGIFVIPDNCVCDIEAIRTTLNPNILMKVPYKIIRQGGYYAKYHYLTYNYGINSNDWVVVIDDKNHPCLCLDNSSELSETETNRLLSSIGFAKGYDTDGFLNFKYMITNLITSDTNALLFRLINKNDGTTADQTMLSINENGLVAFNGNTDANYDYTFNNRHELNARSMVGIKGTPSGLYLETANNSLAFVTDDDKTRVFSKSTEIVRVNSGDITIKQKVINNADRVESIGTIDGATPTLTYQYNIVNNSSATTMTNITSGSNVVTLVFANGNTTVKHGSGIVLKDATDWTPTMYSSITLLKPPTTLANSWIEINRTEI